MAYGVNKPFGLRPIASLTGGGVSVNIDDYNILTNAAGTTTYARSIYKGDVVCFNNASAGYIGTIADIGAGFPIGVFQGCIYTDTNGFVQESSFWVASTQVKANTPIIAKVVDDPTVIFEVQISSQANVEANAQLVQTMFGKNGNLSIGGGGNQVVGNPATGGTNGNVSAYYLDGGAIAATSTNMFRIRGYSKNALNFPLDTAGAVRQFLTARVTFNVHADKSVGTTGI